MRKFKIRINPSLERLDLVTKGLVNTKAIGNYASTFKGEGLEFASFRAYTPSDDASKIDWVTSNRARKCLIKEYVEERNLNVYFILDVSSKMMLGTVSKLKCEYAAEFVASFSNLVLRAGDFVGITLFSDKMMKNVVLGGGMGQLHIISETMSNLSHYGGGFNLKAAFSHALSTFKKGSLVILVSDFISDQEFKQELKFAANKFDLIGVSVRDPIDFELPRGMGQLMVEDPASADRILVTPNKVLKNYSQEAHKQINDFHKEFKNSGADFLSLKTDKSFVEELVIFFNKRRTEWR